MDLDSLASKIQENHNRLEAIEEQLKRRPGDELLLKLREDLKQILSLTYELFKAKQNKSSTPSSSSVKSWNPNVSDKCWAKWPEDGQWYVSKVLESLASDRFRVVYLEYGNESEVGLEEMKPLSPLNTDLIEVGKRCRAVLPTDGLLHRGVLLRKPVAAIKTYRIQFEDVQNGVEEEIHLEDILFLDELGDGAQNTQKEKDMPSNLKIRETDTEKQKQVKKRKLKALEREKEIRQVEIERSVKQASWLAFKNGQGARKKTGFLSTTKKESIFKSPDSVDGKVGVIGSGKAMTKYHVKNKFGKPSSSIDPGN